MTEKVYKKIQEVRILWSEIYAQSRYMSFYQSYSWNKILEERFHSRRFSRYMGCCLVYYVFNNKIIVPLVVNKCQKTIYILGQDEVSDYLSFVFSDASQIELIDVIHRLLKIYDGFCFKLDKINQSNPLSIAIRNAEKRFGNVVVEPKKCVYVGTKVETASFYDSLSKSMKQNYRTAKNRLKKNNLNYTVKIDFNKKLSDDEINQFHELYVQRRSDCRADDNTIFLKKILKRLLYCTHLERECDVISEFSKIEPVFLATITIDNQIAAFCEGKVCNNSKVLSIARVATNRHFYEFSPGQILLIDTIEEIRSCIDYFDLTRGNEEYKFRLGGRIHYNYCYEIKSEKG